MELWLHIICACVCECVQDVRGRGNYNNAVVSAEVVPLHSMPGIKTPSMLDSSLASLQQVCIHATWLAADSPLPWIFASPLALDGRILKIFYNCGQQGSFAREPCTEQQPFMTGCCSRHCGIQSVSHQDWRPKGDSNKRLWTWIMRILRDSIDSMCVARH